MRNKLAWIVPCIILGSIALRIVLAPYLIFEWDELGTYLTGLEFFKTGLPPDHGQTMSTGTTLPGMLQGLLTGLPLFFTHGSPIGAAVGLALFMVSGLALIFQMLRCCFPEVSTTLLALFVFGAPWTFFMASIMNPHYVLPFAALFYLGLFQLTEKPADKTAEFWMVFSIPMMFQLHLSAVAPLIQWIVFIHVGIIPVPRLFQTLGGFAAGSALMTPYFIRRLTLPAAAKSGITLSSSLALTPERIFELPKMFFRFLSFATGDTTRFIVGGRGYLMIFTLLKNHPILLLSYLIAMLGSGLIIFFGLRFFWKKISLLRFSFHFRGARKLSSTEKKDLTVILAVLMTGTLFSFSSRGPSAQTIWFLLPLALYTPLRALQEWKAGPFRRSEKSDRSSEKWAWGIWIYLVSALIFSVFSYIQVIELHRLKDFLFKNYI